MAKALTPVGVTAPACSHRSTKSLTLKIMSRARVTGSHAAADALGPQSRCILSAPMRMNSTKLDAPAGRIPPMLAQPKLKLPMPTIILPPEGDHLTVVHRCHLATAATHNRAAHPNLERSRRPRHSPTTTCNTAAPITRSLTVKSSRHMHDAALGLEFLHYFYFIFWENTFTLFLLS